MSENVKAVERPAILPYLGPILTPGLAAAATWFIAETKLKWRAAYERDPELARQLEVDVLPALSTANVRELMQAVLPVPQLSPQQARDVVATHLVNRARSTASRLRTQGFHEDSG